MVEERGFVRLAKLGGVRLELPQLHGLCARHDAVSWSYNHEERAVNIQGWQSKDREHYGTSGSSYAEGFSLPLNCGGTSQSILVLPQSTRPGFLSFDINHPKLGVVVQACNPYTWEVESGVLGVQIRKKSWRRSCQ